MFGAAKTAFSSRAIRRAVGVSALSLTGIGITTSVAFAKSPNSTGGPDPLKIELSEVTTGVPKLTPRDLAEVRAVEVEPPQQDRRAYNPETGEIDWDCPCLGGMAHGPCGEEFKEAFSCFVYSKEEIKGSECIPKFSAMQNCFRKYPEVYADFQDDENVETTRGTGAATGDVAPGLKEKATETAGKVADNANAAVDKAKQTAKDTANGTAKRANELSDSANAAVKDVAQSLGSAKESAKETAKSKAQDAQDGLKKGASSVAGAASDKLKQTQDSASHLANRAKNSVNKAPIADAKDDLQDREKEMDTELELDDKIQHLKTDLSNVANDLHHRSAELNKKAAAPSAVKKGNRDHLDHLKSHAGDDEEVTANALQKSAEFVSGAVAGVTAEAQDVAKAVSDKFK